MDQDQHLIDCLLNSDDPSIQILANSLRSVVPNASTNAPKIYGSLGAILACGDEALAIFLDSKQYLEAELKIPLNEDIFDVIRTIHDQQELILGEVEGEESKTSIFKQLYKKAIPANPETLQSPYSAISMLDILMSDRSDDDIQNALLELLGFENIEILSQLILNRADIVSMTKEAQTAPVKQTNAGNPNADPYKFGSQVTVMTAEDKRVQRDLKKLQRNRKNQKTTNLELLVQLGFDSEFVHENHRLGLKRKEFEEQEDEPQGLQYTIPQGFKRNQLPQNTIVVNEEYYKMYTVPAPQKAAVAEEFLIPIDALPEWARPAFKEVKRFNPMQSQVFECIFYSNDNVLVSAPTGAGKTNIALLGVVNIIRSFMDEDQVIAEEFKIIYVAPMKALAAEVTSKFSEKLGYLGIICRELTGDMQMTKAEIARTHIIVTTPEKWDVITRKSDSFAGQVKLLIIDEIHLLDDERGPVLECLVSRALRQVEISQNSMRIVALSATLPNYTDVARFINAPENGIFYFDGKYRPIPLEQNFIATKTVANVEKQKAFIMDATYEMTLKHLKNDKQVMIFVHSRRDTISTANKLRDLAINNGDLGWFENCYSQQSMIQVGKSRNRDLKFLFESGFGIHNAGMLRKDRTLTEQLFKDKNLNVLVCTATLAWGVNLPAHCVIIKGTEIYDANVGGFRDIGQLDVQQIFGRAGRPDYDTSGSAYIVTSGAKIQQYLEMLVFQKPIESKFLGGLEDAMNAEICLGTVSSIKDAIRWLTYTYFNIRLMRNPLCYGFKHDELATAELRNSAMDRIIREAAKKLHRTRMIRFSEASTSMSITSLGRIASHYYIKAESIAVYTKAIHEAMTDEEILDMFSNSSEFEQIKVRDEEMQELHTIRDNLCDNWIQLDKKALNDVPGKVICLLWAYWAQLPLDAFSLVSDMSYIIQNGGRILRALFEICQKRFYGCTSERLLQIGRGLERRVILGYTPLYQFSQRCNIGGFTAFSSNQFNKGGFISEEILFKLDSRGFDVDQLRELPAHEIGAVLNHQQRGQEVKKFLRLLPRLDFDFVIRPITGNIVNFDLTLKPAFDWSDRWHGNTLSYWIWVDDGSSIMHVEHYALHKSVWEKNEKPILSFAVPVQEDKRNGYYYVRIYGEHWIGVDIDKEADMSKVILPLDDVQHTELLDLVPLPKSVLQNPMYESLFSFDYFNPIQTQVFHTLYHSDTNALVGAPTGSGKTITAELALFRLFNNYPKQKAIYVAPLKALAKERIKDWRKRFENVLGRKVVELTGDFTPDIDALNNASILVTTPEKWDGISRNWQHRGYVREVGLVIIDEIHLLGQDRGPVLEVIVSRMRYISNQVNKTCRIIGLSTALANAQDLANWLGIGIQGFFNFRPSVRPVPLQVHIDGFTEKAYCPRMASMNKPCYNAIRTYASDKPALVFVSSRRQTRLTAFDLIAYCAAESVNTHGFLQIPSQEMAAITTSIIDSNLRHTLNFGIGLHHSGLPENDRNIVEELFANGSIYILICTSTLAWGVNFPAHLVIIKGTEYFEAKERRYVDFPMTDVLQMMGRAGRPQFDTNGTVCVYVQEEKRNYYKTFLYQPFPVESSLVEQLPAHINAEINSGTITSKLQALNYLTWTYFFRRLTRNPKYYGLEDHTLEGINTKLGEVVDEALGMLIENGCIQLDEDNSIKPQFLGYIASFYYISPVTCKIFKSQLEVVPNISFEQILRLLCDAEEFDEIPVRHNEDQVNDEISKMVPLAVDRRMLEDPHVKTFLLLQSWFTGISFPISDYITDAKLVIDSIVRIIYAMVDIAAEYSTMENTLKAATLLQMIVQGQWYYQSSMKNVPGMTEERLYKLFNSDYNIETLSQLVETDPQKLEQILRDCDLNMSPSQLKTIARTIDIVPRIRVSWELVGDTEEGASSDEDLWGDSTDPAGPGLYPGNWQKIQIKLERENKYASNKPAFAKTTRSVEAGCWIILGDKETNKVLAIKRVSSLKRRFLKYEMGVTVPESSEIELLLISDSYLGLDQQYTIS